MTQNLMKVAGMRLIAGVALVGGLAFLAQPTWAAEAAPEVKNSEETYRLLNLFGDVFERIRSQYVDKPTDEELVESAITGMLQDLRAA